MYPPHGVSLHRLERVVDFLEKRKVETPWLALFKSLIALGESITSFGDALLAAGAAGAADKGFFNDVHASKDVDSQRVRALEEFIDAIIAFIEEHDRVTKAKGKEKV